MFRLIALTGVAITVFLVVGFFRFSLTVANYETSSPSGADGIVVLTGGHSRIATGLKLLENKFAKRLLISGVNPDTSSDAISYRFTNHKSLLACCVDLDRHAHNTTQNARETANWVKQKGYKSLIVVTSDYHLPRALLELSLATPGTILFPIAARPVSQTHTALLSESEHLRIMAKEFAKTIVVSLLALIPG